MIKYGNFRSLGRRVHDTWSHVMNNICTKAEEIFTIQYNLHTSVILRCLPLKAPLNSWRFYDTWIIPISLFVVS